MSDKQLIIIALMVNFAILLFLLYEVAQIHATDHVLYAQIVSMEKQIESLDDRVITMRDFLIENMQLATEKK